MKNLFAVIMMLSTIGFANAQTRVGYVALAPLVDSLSAKANIKQQISDYQKRFELGLQQLSLSATRTSGPYDGYRYATDAEKEQELARLKALQVTIQQYSIGAQKQIDLKMTELLKPIQDSVKSAITQLAKTQGYDYVIDTSVKGLTAFSAGDDLTAAVKLKLGIK